MAKAKKSFKENPALQFCSAVPTETEEQDFLVIEEVPEAPKKEEEQPKETKKTTRKKNAPKGYKLNPMYVELKTRRVQLVFKPSVYDKVKARADQEGVSFNEYVHDILEDLVKEELL